MVRKQMSRLLETTHFRNSKRYPALFRFIVEETLAGRGEFLKERLLGVSVFDRPADYDTASDPIVRVTIAEIRKRIAQYYHEEAHDSEMRIELMPGHYVPEFRPRRDPHPQQPHVLHHEPGPFNPSAQVGPIPVTSAPPKQRHRLAIMIGSLSLVLAVAAGILYWQMAGSSAVDEFWRPVLASHRTVIFCLPSGADKSGAQIAAAAGILSPEGAAVPTPGAHTVDPNDPRSSTFLIHETAGENVVFSDVLATIGITDWMAIHNRDSKLRLTLSTTLDDLRQGPSIVIGGLDNEWTLRAVAPLRYRFAGNNSETYWISDTKNPAFKSWGVDLKVPYDAVVRDYSIIARVHDQSTGQIVVIVAGIGMSGTAAAGEFLVDPHQIEELRRQIGPRFHDHDFEAVLGTDVVNGIAGTPKILAISVM